MKDSAKNQRHGDVWANTMVVKSARLPKKSRRSIGWFFLALFLGATLHTALLTLGLVLKAI